MMLAGEFKANGLLHFKPYAITGKLKAGQITWSNGTVYTRDASSVAYAEELAALNKAYYGMVHKEQLENLRNAHGCGGASA